MGHTVLAVPVPELDGLVRERTEFYDASFVSSDPGFVHAHITVLAPWVPKPTKEDVATVARIAAAVRPVEVTLADLDVFPDGTIHLRPEPDEPFRALTAAVTAAHPQHPPYAGRFPDPIPHLTLDHVAGGVTREEVRARLIGQHPITFVLDRLDLQWWANYDCRLLQSFPLRAR